MAKDTFRFVGKIKKRKDGFTSVNYNSGWEMSRLKFLVTAGDNTQFIDVSGGKWADNSKNQVFTYEKKTKEDGSVEYAKLNVPWSERFDPEIVDRVAAYRYYTVDTDTIEHRDYLEKTGKDDELAESLEKKKKFITLYDYTQYLNKLLEEDVFGDDTYVVSGNIEYTYSADKDAYYRNFAPTNIYKAKKDAEQKCSGKVDLYYNADVLGDVSDNGDTPVGGYVQFYDGMSKQNYFAPFASVIKGNFEKHEGFVKMLSKKSEAEVRRIGLELEFINSAEKVDITYDMLSDAQKEMIEMGLVTLEEIVKEQGGQAYGDRITETRVVGIARGYTSGPQDTEYESLHLYEKPGSSSKRSSSEKSSFSGSENSKKFDLFSDDIDDI